MKLIVTRPQHDVTTRYISSWAGEIISFAQQKNIDIIDLAKEKASRDEFEGRVKKLQPAAVFLNGHGSESSVCGHDNETIVAAEENHTILAHAITYAVSCDSAKVLGEKVTENNQATYIGYKDEFIFMADQRYIARPLDDPKAEPFKESSNQVMTSLLKGNTAQVATERARDLFRNYSIKLSSSSADQDALQSAQFLWWNMRNLVCLGDTDAKLGK